MYSARVLGVAILTTLAIAGDLPIYTPAPILRPAYESCEQFHLVNAGESCFSIIQPIGLSEDEFHRINPAINPNSANPCPVIAGNWYCVKAQPAPAHKAHPQPQHSGSQPKPTKKPKPANTAEQPEPELTEGPEPGECKYGSCWQAFADLSYFSEYGIPETASDLCTRLFNEHCEDSYKDKFPDRPQNKVREGCKNCKELSSACPCYTAGKYHTNTAELIWGTRK